jgi:hypothetical protein
VKFAGATLNEYLRQCAARKHILCVREGDTSDERRLSQVASVQKLHEPGQECRMVDHIFGIEHAQ